MDTSNLDMQRILEPGVLIALAVGAILLVSLSTLLTGQKDPQEPPFLAPGIPVVGHLIRMFAEGADYYTRLYHKSHQGLYTLPIFRGRLYIVSSPEWITACMSFSLTRATGIC